jgi:hypothetical protein
MKSFWDYIFDTQNNSGGSANWQLGKAQAWSKDTMAPTIDWTYSSAPESWRAVIQGCLLFGDPAQRLKPKLFDEEPPVTTLSYTGNPGDNDWYKSEGNVVLTAIDSLSSVDITYYKINNGDWEVYTDPFAFNEEGLNLFCFYSIDIAGNIESIQSDFLKIDCSPPSTLLTKQTISNNEIKYIAHISDDVSGEGYAEFYLDGELQFTDTESPFEWLWEGTGSHTTQAYGYDLAGNIGESNAPFLKKQVSAQRNIVQEFLQKINHYSIFK